VGIDTQGSAGLDVYSASLGLTFTSKVYLGVSANLWTNGGEYTSTGDSSWSGNLGSDSWTYSATESNEYSGLNFNVGAIVRPSDKIQLGLVYKTPFSMDLTRNRDRSYVYQSGYTYDYTYLYDGAIEWPQTIGVGVAVSPSDAVTLSADFTTAGWSEATYDYYYSYTRLASGDDPYYIDRDYVRSWPTYDNPDNPETGVNLYQVDTQQLRFGAEYVMMDPPLEGLVAMPIRAGVFTDQQLFKSSDRSEVTYLGLTAGVGFVWSRVTLDIAFVRLTGDFLCCRYTYQSGDYSYDSNQERADGYSSNRLYVSTTVRLGR
jgi:long-subunit fatty acid transport protein